MEIKVISWNIWGGKKREEIIDFLQKQNADIIALQEVTSHEVTNREEHDTKIIAEKLGYNYYFTNAFTTDRHFPSYSIGNAILTKHTIQSSNTHMLSDLSDYQKNATTEPRNAVQCDIIVENTLVHVFSTHLGYSDNLHETSLQKKQLENLLQNIPITKSILMGDFNSIPESTIIKKIEKTLLHTDKNLDKTSWVDLKKENQPHYRIDYIFTTPDIHTPSSAIGTSTASDHLPLIVNLTI